MTILFSRIWLSGQLRLSIIVFIRCIRIHICQLSSMPFCVTEVFEPFSVIFALLCFQSLSFFIRFRWYFNRSTYCIFITNPIESVNKRMHGITWNFRISNVKLPKYSTKLDWMILFWYFVIVANPLKDYSLWRRFRSSKCSFWIVDSCLPELQEPPSNWPTLFRLLKINICLLEKWIAAVYN